jgi:hypothetical protein
LELPVPDEVGVNEFFLQPPTPSALLLIFIGDSNLYIPDLIQVGSHLAQRAPGEKLA